jgi:hypothetical protein
MARVIPNAKNLKGNRRKGKIRRITVIKYATPV